MRSATSKQVKKYRQAKPLTNPLYLTRNIELSTDRVINRAMEIFYQDAVNASLYPREVIRDKFVTIALKEKFRELGLSTEKEIYQHGRVTAYKE